MSGGVMSGEVESGGERRVVVGSGEEACADID